MGLLEKLSGVTIGGLGVSTIGLGMGSLQEYFNLRRAVIDTVLKNAKEINPDVIQRAINSAHQLVDSTSYASSSLGIGIAALFIGGACIGTSYLLLRE